MRHEPTVLPEGEVSRYSSARRDLPQPVPEFVCKAPVRRVAGGLRDPFKRELKQPVLCSVSRKDVLPQLEQVMPSGWLPHLPDHVELSPQEGLFCCHPNVVEAQSALNKHLQASQETPDDPLAQRRLKVLQ